MGPLFASHPFLQGRRTPMIPLSIVATDAETFRAATRFPVVERLRATSNERHDRGDDDDRDADRARNDLGARSETLDRNGRADEDHYGDVHDSEDEQDHGQTQAA